MMHILMQSMRTSIPLKPRTPLKTHLLLLLMQTLSQQKHVQQKQFTGAMKNFITTKFRNCSTSFAFFLLKFFKAMQLTIRVSG